MYKKGDLCIDLLYRFALFKMKHFTVQKGCQTLECINGGFCDGHDTANPVCFCHKGFTGQHCEQGDTNF
jgi:hypothetical protein